MPGLYNIRHPTTKSTTATIAEPWIYFTVDEVSFSTSHKLINSPRPNADQKYRSVAMRERRVQLIGVAVETSDGTTGVRTSSSEPSGSGKAIREELEDAWENWKASGSARLQLGTKDDGTANTYDGIIEGITFSWNPGKSDDDAETYKFTMSFKIGTVS